MVSSACGTSRLIPNVPRTNILKIEGGHCFYVLPAIARSPICCLFPTSNRADARMFSLPCAYSCPGIYNAITAMAVSSSFNCFKLIKHIYIPFISPTFTHVHPSAPLLPPPPRSPHTVAALRHSLTQTHCIKCGSQLYSIAYIYLFLENDVRRVESATLA